MIGEDFDTVVSAARTGAEWAIAALYSDVQPRLLAYLRARVGGEGEDLASDVWMAVAGALGRFEGDEAGFRALVFTIARRHVVSFWRFRERRRTDSVAPGAFDGMEGNESPDLAALESVTTAEVIARLTAHLSDDQADIVLLRVIGGLSAEEVGRLVGRSPGAVRVAQHRALRRLAAIFSADPLMS